MLALYSFSLPRKGVFPLKTQIVMNLPRSQRPVNFFELPFIKRPLPCLFTPSPLCFQISFLFFFFFFFFFFSDAPFELLALPPFFFFFFRAFFPLSLQEANPLLRFFSATSLPSFCSVIREQNFSEVLLSHGSSPVTFFPYPSTEE